MSWGFGPRPSEPLTSRQAIVGTVLVLVGAVALAFLTALVAAGVHHLWIALAGVC